MAANQHSNIPILTDEIMASERDETSEISAPETDALLDAPACQAEPDTASARRDNEMLIAELQTRLASAAFALTEDAMRAAFSEMEAKLYQQISARLRSELPELVDSLLREHLDVDRDA